MLVQRIGTNNDLDPFSAPGDDRQRGRPRVHDPHIVLELGHMLFGRRLLRERPGQHKLGLKYPSTWTNQAIKGGSHPTVDRVVDPFLDATDSLAGVALVPSPVQVFGDAPELNDKVVGEILRLNLPSFLAPQPNQGGLVITHDQSGVRPAYETNSIILQRVANHSEPHLSKKDTYVLNRHFGQIKRFSTESLFLQVP